jgi:hypothetical protein
VFAVSGRGIDSRLIVDAPSGRLGDSRLEVTDRAAHVCPVGAILPRHRAGDAADRRGYRVPIGERLYDRAPISRVGDVAMHDHSPGSDGPGHVDAATSGGHAGSRPMPAAQARTAAAKEDG